jgi:type VI secretion system protein ImpG
MDLEVHSVTRVSGIGATSGAGREFRPFYSASSARLHDTQAGFYTLHRTASRLRPHSERQQSTYPGSETFISLVDGQEGPYRSDLRQLSVDTLCTNRDLPMYLTAGHGNTDFHLETGAPVEVVHCLSGPTFPKPSNAWGHTSWMLISHLSLNHLSLNNAEKEGATALRDLLQLYGHLADPAIRRQIDGVRSVSSTRVVRRLPGQPRATFGRGFQIRLDCDETAFEGGSVFLLGAVLERFFARYASLNSFTETQLHTAQRGEIMLWPTRLGLKGTA